MGDPHEKNPNSVNITLKKMTMKICRGVGDWGEVEKYTEFYHRISNSDEELSKIIAVLFFLV